MLDCEKSEIYDLSIQGEITIPINILIIDDEPIVRKGLSYLLRHTEIDGTHIEVFESDGSLNANQILNENEFDIVFTDINMPVMDGLTLIDKWRNKLNNTQWVILSGYDNFDYAQQAVSLGVKEYLLKPITKKNARETLERLITNHHKLRNNFIGMNELDELRIKLEEAIWTLDEDLATSSITSWAEKMIPKEIERSYYFNTLNNLLSHLIMRINNKGSIRLEDHEVEMKGKSLELITRNFQMACIKLIDRIRLQRKGQFIDPIEFAKEYIKENLSNKITLNNVADKIGLNSAYFSHLFKKETGISFIEFRMQLRMEEAKQLMESGNMKITDIANNLGYEDLSHFTKTFKKYTGFAPSKYISMMGIH